MVTPCGEFADRLGRSIDEHAHHFLVGAPVTAAHRVLEMHVLVVALRLDHVAQARLHASLSRARVRALRWDQGQDDDIVATAPRADAHAKPGEAAANDQYIGIDHFHRTLSRATIPSVGATAWGNACKCEGT